MCGFNQIYILSYSSLNVTLSDLQFFSKAKYLIAPSDDKGKYSFFKEHPPPPDSILWNP